MVNLSILRPREQHDTPNVTNNVIASHQNSRYHVGPMRTRVSMNTASTVVVIPLQLVCICWALDKTWFCRPSFTEARDAIRAQSAGVRSFTECKRDPVAVAKESVRFVVCSSVSASENQRRANMKQVAQKPRMLSM